LKKNHTMKTRSSIFYLLMLLLLFVSCKKEEGVKTGNLQVSVIDQDNLPVNNAMVSLIKLNKVQYTNNGGFVNFTGLDVTVAYRIMVVKPTYDTVEVQGISLVENTKVNQSVLLTVHPQVGLSQTTFDFDSTLTQLPLMITNLGTGVLEWEFRFGEVNWISADPLSGYLISDPALVLLIINRTQLKEGNNQNTVFLQSNGGIKEIVIKAYQPIPPVNDSITDIDGNRYGTIKIGSQVWMKENLRVTHNPAGSSILSYYYENNPAYLQIYGRLYTWPVAMNDATNEMAQGICPDGWHIPSNEEVNTLALQLGGAQVAGGKLKSTGTEFWLPPNTGATNSSGFSALPGGDRWYDGTFHYLGERAFFWNSTIFNSEMAYLSYLLNDSTNLKIKEVITANSMPVRCIKNP